MKRIASLIFLPTLLLAFIGIRLRPNDVSADGAFSVKDLNGTFSFSAEGTLYPAFPAVTPAWPAVAAGLFTFDGAGDCTVVDELNIAAVGLVPPAGMRRSTSCHYTVNADGSGGLETSFGGSAGEINGPGSLTFTIVEKGPVMELRFIRSDPGAVAMGVAREQQ